MEVMPKVCLNLVYIFRVKVVWNILFNYKLVGGIPMKTDIEIAQEAVMEPIGRC